MSSLTSSPSSVSKLSICDKVTEDIWSSSPPQVTTVLTFTRLSTPAESSAVVYTSPTCGLGWRFHVVEKYPSAKTPDPNSQSQVSKPPSTATVQLSYQPPPSKLATLAFSVDTVRVKVTYPDDPSQCSHEREFKQASLKEVHQLGSYEEPPHYKGSTHITISLLFSASEALSFPTTPHPNTPVALSQSLDEPAFIDTKFYLFSAKRRSMPTKPKAVYAKSLLLMNASSYLDSLLSTNTSFSNGTPCLLKEETSEEIAKLTAEKYDYDSDSDLESLLGDDDNDDVDDGEKELVPKVETTNGPSEENPKDVAKEDTAGTTTDAPTPEETERLAETPKEESNKSSDIPPLSAVPSDGRAFAINGTAHKTWKAFILYVYTNKVQFNSLKSENKPCVSSAAVSCSPKSMYRLADYASLLELKAAAKEGIRQKLSRTNIVSELFSTFTSRYQEIIEMEVGFLLKEFDEHLGQQLDEIIQLVVVGEKPHCYRVLVFLMRRQRGQDAETAWKALAKMEPGGLLDPIKPSGSLDPPRNPFEFVSNSSKRRSKHSGRTIASNARATSSNSWREPQRSVSTATPSPPLFRFNFGPSVAPSPNGAARTT
ncbi:hypothetical protein NP233_g2256 [Leucocoprinus birnbaumii]|uniref:Uncharacterized protein n=1 Tax=Leucocoprinus birnbaumii TaxID=56174 RepID=A0AAD5W4R6_9AGAR|nr:hypothetical protein NP233_g2256 [Leucocoprinus birnbaumii]